ncbi:recombinase family protein [Nocardiopsis dassonvillei]|uniref:recombinase family protein n=1 Tax=Nocardiopsis dassonvillei TaxID=2014 RepID=UPI0033C53993
MADHPHLTDRRPRVTLYARVSSDRRRHGRQRSVKTQLTIGHKNAAAKVWNVVGEYADNDRSASGYASREREDWPKVEADIAAGRTDILWAIEISRGTRDLEVWARLAKACKKQGVLIALEEDVWDPRKPSHMKHLNQMMIDAVFESDRTHERVNRDTTANAERGGVHGHWGYGFRHQYDPESGELLERVVYEPEAKVVREMAQRYLSGDGLLTIAVDLNQRRVPTASGYVAGDPILDGDGNPVLDELGNPRHSPGWYYQVIKQILLRSSMIGRRSHKGKIIDKGGHEPIFDGTVVNGMVLDEAAWWKIRKKLLADAPSAGVSMLNSGERNDVQPRDGSAKRDLGGIALCGVCGAPMYPNPNKRSKHGWAYRCDGLYPGAPSACVSRTGPFLDKAVETLVIARFSRPDALRAFRPLSGSPEEVAAAQARKAALDAEMDELVSDVEAGVVSRRLAAADERRIQAELDKLAGELRPDVVEPLAKELASTDPRQVLATWTGWSTHQRRRALRTLARKIVVPKVGMGRRNIPPQEYVHITWVGDEE